MPAGWAACPCDKYQLLCFGPYIVKPVLSGHSKRRPKTGFKNPLSLNAVQKYCRMLQENTLQYCQPALSYHLSLRPLFCLFLSGRLRQVSLYNFLTMRIYSACWVIFHAVCWVMGIFFHAACWVIFHAIVVVC